ncbi:hypothetical protein AB205_0013740 [Aquarana catesbeiana]|uniref:EGF-like domain-containing protein n=1 Tax=Aquarana catesbeiana TaxID=8400 RepID=A0A2G9SI68_AQUCT|nr:hypothetical protein AB205_0013740 [Aquarana catesbeiana]
MLTLFIFSYADDYAQLCNLRVPRFRQPYGEDALHFSDHYMPQPQPDPFNLQEHVNECNELNSRMSLCKNAKCINTEGSYKCVCLPGYIPSDKPNYCTAINSDRDDSELE